MGVLDGVAAGVRGMLGSITEIKTIADGRRSLYQMSPGQMPAVCYEIALRERSQYSYDGKEAIAVDIDIDGITTWVTGGKDANLWGVVETIQDKLYYLSVPGGVVSSVEIRQLDTAIDDGGKYALFQLRARAEIIR